MAQTRPSARFSLRRASLSSVSWYLSVPFGWVVICIAGYEVLATPAINYAPAFYMAAGLLVILELLPLMQGRGHDPQGLVMSTAFLCAILFCWGVWPAVVCVTIASLASDIRRGKSRWKVLFNPAQYALSIGAAYLVMTLTGHPASLAHPMHGLFASDIAWVAGAWLAYFLVNLVLVAAVVSFDTPFLSLVSDDFWHYTLMTFAVMALSPVIVLVAHDAWPLLPLLLIPLLLLYYTASMSLEREHAAGHDPLTGLPNRTTLQYELDKAQATYRRDDVPFALMVIDLDDFKRVNDTLGHQVGDRLLVEFASRLRERVRPGDLVARLGGDEFAVIVYEADVPAASAIADRLRESVSQSIDLGGLGVEVEASVGLAACPAHGTDAMTLLRRADIAMYGAKEKRSRYEVYQPDRDLNSADRLGLLAELRQALLDEAIELHYQPKVSTTDRFPIGVEALIRWRHPTRGYISPDEFIPLAEGSGIMPLLTARVIELGLRQTAQWRDEGLIVPVAVNIAPTDLTGDRLPEIIDRGLTEYELSPGMLQLEITERIVTHQLEESKRTLDRLRGMGVTISLDDFGTGYSSLLRLSSLHVDEIKVDRGFVSAMAEGARAIGIVRALVDLAHALGMPAVAEGVETAEELRQLELLGCDAIQGWHIARPMPSAAATSWLHERMPGGPLAAPGAQPVAELARRALRAV